MNGLALAVELVLHAQFGGPMHRIDFIFSGTPAISSEAPDFFAAEAGPPLQLGGLRAEQLPPGDEVQRACEALSDRDRAVHVLALKFNPTELRAALAQTSRLQALGHDLLFRANPDTEDSTRWDPAYKRWDPRTQTFILSPLERRNAFETFTRIEETHRHPGGSEQRWHKVTTLVDALLRDETTHLFEVHWDNKDDTAFDGLIAVDAQTGFVRVLMSNDFA